MSGDDEKPRSSGAAKPMGFWAAWSLTVGVMIGSGVFPLPSVLAPFGLLSFAGWLFTAGGAILLGLTIARLAGRVRRSGGVYVYVRDAFGDRAGFFIAWGYWASYWISIPAIAIAFVGYLGVFFPVVIQNSMVQAIVALALIWGVTLINIRGVREAAMVQLIMTVLKLAPLVLVIAIGLVSGDVDNLPAVNPSGAGLLSVLTTCALLTMWAFSGLEAGAMPAGEIDNAERVIPRAIVTGVITVAFVYIASTAAVMALVPAEQLIHSTAPFADAVRPLGAWAPYMIAIGAMISTAGALNGIIFVTGQMPMAVAVDGLAPAIFARQDAGRSPYISLLLAAVLSSLLLVANFSKGLVGMFQFLIMMSTTAILIPMLMSAAAEFSFSRRLSALWTAVAVAAFLYCIFTIAGAGATVLFWGVILMVSGAPVYLWSRQSRNKTA